MIGIYKITNPNGRVYIGQSRNIENRKRHYFKIYGITKKQSKIYNSLMKHGVDNHTWEIIEECDISDLNQREIFWKKHYLDLVKGDFSKVLFHNLEDGLKSQKNEKWKEKRIKPLLQYDLEGNFIKEWESAQYYALNNNLTNGTLLTRCARKKTPSAYGFIWEYKTENYPLKIDPVCKNWEKMEILQYDLEGNFIKKWDSIKEAANMFNSRGQNIVNNLKKRTKSAHGYVWVYK